MALEVFEDINIHLRRGNVHGCAVGGSSIFGVGKQHLWQERLGLPQEGAGGRRWRKVLEDQLAPLIAKGRNTIGLSHVMMEGSWQLQIRPVVAEVCKVLEGFPCLLFLCSSARPQGKKAGRWKGSHFPAGEGPQVWQG